MSHGIGGYQSQPGYLLRSDGVGIEQVGLCRSFAKLSKKQLNRNVCRG